MKTLLTFALVILSLTSCVSIQKQAEDGMKLPVSHFKEKMRIKNDSLDTVATFSTQDGLKFTRGLLKIVWEDCFLQAFVDKKTGATTYQVYNWIRYQGSGWRYYNRANYETPDGPKSVPVKLIGRDVDCAGSRYGGCTYLEQVAFDLDEKLLKIMVGMYNPEKPGGWKFKLGSKAGGDFNDGILAQELVAIYETVEAFKKSEGLN
jgi:hypothetical protein